MKLKDMLSVAENAAITAGRHALSVTGLTKQEYKSDDQIVTEADRDCQAIIVEKIKSNWPGHGFIGEEGENGQIYKVLPTGQDDIWWIIDPIDGTRNYANGEPNYAVSIAALQAGSPIVGVIYDPNTEMIFSAIKDGPATRNGKPIQSRNEPLDNNSQVAISGNYSPPTPRYIFSFLEQFVCMNLGSAALHYAYVAMGAYTGAFSFKVKLWDIAAGALLCEQAGAVVTTLQDKPVFPFECQNYHGDPIPVLMAGKTAHQQLMKIIQSDNDR